MQVIGRREDYSPSYLLASSSKAQCAAASYSRHRCVVSLSPLSARHNNMGVFGMGLVPPAYSPPTWWVRADLVSLWPCFQWVFAQVVLATAPQWVCLQGRCSSGSQPSHTTTMVCMCAGSRDSSRAPLSFLVRGLFFQLGPLWAGKPSARTPLGFLATGGFLLAYGPPT